MHDVPFSHIFTFLDQNCLNILLGSKHILAHCFPCFKWKVRRRFLGHRFFWCADIQRNVFASCHLRSLYTQSVLQVCVLTNQSCREYPLGTELSTKRDLWLTPIRGRLWTTLTIIYLTTLTSKSTNCSFKIRTWIKLSKINIHMKY